MRKILFSFSFAFVILLAKAQVNTATDFTVNDCNNVSHHLFAELNAGKVVILGWVMPCSNCVAPCQVAWNVANSYSANPGQVVFYIADDIGNTSCATLNNWITTNSLTSTAAMSNSLINMNDYGTQGMPKMVVLAGPTTHSVYFNEDGGINITQSGVQSAVAAAVSDVSGIKENQIKNFRTKLSPNPASNLLQIDFSSNNVTDLSAEIFNSIGQKVKEYSIRTNIGANKNSSDISELNSGVYFLKLSDGKNSDISKFIITH